MCSFRVDFGALRQLVQHLTALVISTGQTAVDVRLLALLVRHGRSCNMLLIAETEYLCHTPDEQLDCTLRRKKPEKEPEMWNGINLTELLEKSVPPKPKSNKVLDTLIVVSLVMIVVSKLSAPRPLGAEPSGIIITAKEYGSRWPFVDKKLRIICWNPNEVQLRQETTSERFALTNAALNAISGMTTYHSLLKPGADEFLIPELIQRGLELCPPGR